MEEELRVISNACLQVRCCECCKDVQLRLTDEEYAFMRSGGTRLQKKREFMGLWDISNHLSEQPDGKKAYEMEGRCGYLGEDGLCTVYTNPNKPKTCGDTEPGDYGCCSVRAERRLPLIQSDEGIGWE